MEATNQGGTRAALQTRLNLLDERIAALERQKAAAGDDDQPQDIEEAKQLLQSACESYSRGDFQMALGRATRVEQCLSLAHTELESCNRTMTAIGETLKSR
jgi:hypothetical protein